MRWGLVLAIVFGLSARAHRPMIQYVGINPYDSKRFYRRGLVLSSSPQSVDPSGIVITLHDSSGRFIGSATRVCADDALDYKDFPLGHVLLPSWGLWRNAPLDRDWYITPAHVVEAVDSPKMRDGRGLKVEALVSLSDFALLSTPKSGLPCAIPAPSLQLGNVFDIEAAFVLPEIWVEIEAPDVKSLHVESHRMSTVMGAALGSGIPGRDFMGPVGMLLARGFRGQSGGAVLGQPNLSGSLNTMRQYEGIDLRHPYRRLIGMILAVDAEGRRMAVLPSPTLVTLMQQAFAGKLPTSPTVRSVPGGTQYVANGAIHYRGSLASAGAGDLMDGGTGDLMDGGTGDLVDSGTGDLMDGGTGDLVDAGKKSAAKTFPASGVVLEKRRWLTFGNDWSEFEALPFSTFLNLTSDAKLEGLYAEKGQLWASSASVPLPSWSYFSSYADERYTLDEGYTLNWRMPRAFNDTPDEGTAFNACRLTVALMRKRGTTASQGVPLMLCEWGDDSARRIALTPLRNASNVPDLLIEGEVAKHCESGAGPCPVSVKFRATKQPERLKLSDRVVLNSWRAVSKVSPEGDGQLKAHGLRYFTSKDVSVLLTRLGGYRIVMHDRSGGDIEISGPGFIEFGLYPLCKELLRESP